MDQANLRSVSVVAVEGDVVLVDAQGHSRALNSGEFVGSGDIVVTPANGSISLNTIHDQSHSVTGDSAVFFTFDPLEDGLVLAEVDVEDQSDAIDVIQQLIAEGRDPTELLEATAAGGEGAEAVLSSGFSPFINIARSTRFVLAEAGFDTSADGTTAPAVEVLFEEDVLRNVQDTTAPGESDGSKPIVTIPEAFDGINEAELADGAQTEVTLPTGTEAGDTVTLTVTGPDGNTNVIEHTVTPEEAGSGQADITIPAEVLSPDGEYNIVAEVTDPAGNSSEPSTPVTVLVDTTVAASITLDPNTTADVIINIAESGGDVAITGRVDGDIEDGDIITLTVNDNTFTGTASGGLFSIDVPGSELVADPDQFITASVTTTDLADNSATVSVEEGYGVDIIAPGKPVVVISEASDDGYINAVEQPNGTIAEVTLPENAENAENAEEGDILTLTITYPGGTREIEHTLTQADIDSGTQVNIMIPSEFLEPDGDYSVTANVTDKAGNSGEQSDQLAFVVDTLIEAPVVDLSPETDSIAELFPGVPLPGTGHTHDDNATADKELQFIGGVKNP